MMTFSHFWQDMESAEGHASAIPLGQHIPQPKAVRKADALAGVASCPLEEAVGYSISTGETPVVPVVGT